MLRRPYARDTDRPRRNYFGPDDSFLSAGIPHRAASRFAIFFSERVYQEVQDYNRREPEYFKGLVQPTDAEQTLNGYRIRQHGQIDWKAQFEKACQSFEQNGFFVLVNSHQAETLDEEVVIGRDTEVAFVRLMQLVGG